MDKREYEITLRVVVRERVEGIAVLATLQEQLIAIGSDEESGMGLPILSGEVSMREVESD